MSVSLVLANLRSAVRGPFTAEFGAGRCAVITGPSGAGKSLLLRMIADLDPNEGEVRLGGIERRSMDAPSWRRLVTYVAAESGWWDDIVSDHISDREAAIAIMAGLGLEARLFDAQVTQLSTGERQRLALVRAILGKPRFLLLDEPTSALDQDSKLMVESLFSRLVNEGMGLVVVSHDTAQVKRIADRHLALSSDGLAEITA